MNASSPAAPRKPFRMFPELALVLGLPLLSVFIGSTLAVVAYTKGFSPLPEPVAQTARHH